MANKKIKAKKTKNPKIKKEKKRFSIKKLIKSFFYEISYLIKNIGLGVFSIFDFLISFIVSFFTYFYWGIKTFILALWNWGLKLLFEELYNLGMSIYNGGKYILTIIFYDFPVFIYMKTSKYVYDIYMKIKKWYDEQKRISKEKKNSGKTLGKKLKEYIVDKYNNISFVREARERKEASLVIMTIDQSSDDAVRSEVKKTYRYLARNKEGKLIKGYFAALSKLDVYSYLIDEGMTVYEITTSWAINFFHTEASTLKRKMKNKDLIFWLAQLSTYIKAGIPLTDAVKILAKQDKRKKYRSVYDAIIYELTMGESFSEALRKQGNVFPALLVNMVKSAELIGDIENTLDEMSDYYQEIEDTKRAIISALTYPAIVLVFAIAVVIFMLVYIVPQFVGVYESMNAELNPITVTTLNLSAYLKNNYAIIILFITGISILYYVAYKNLKAFRAFMQYIFMHIPVIGKIIITKEISIFARTFATLNKNNILLTDSIDILSKITKNETYKSIMFRTINNLLKGEKMSESFKDHWAIPEIAYYMILTGESTGELAEMLDKVGDFYQKQQRNLINQIKTFIEPIMIAILAVMVGLIIVSIIVPMFGVYTEIM